MKLKALFAGVGSGAGVAWPVFGIMHSALSIPIAGTGALILGAGSISAFFVVALPIAIIYYRELKKNQREQEDNYDDKINKLIDLNLNEFTQKSKSKFFTLSKSQLEIWRMETQVQIQRKIDLELKTSTTPLKKILPPAFGAFVSTFGSIVGCSAGVSGLLTGMGLFTSFAAFPYLGAGILICAALISAVMIFKSIQETRKSHKNQLRLEKIKAYLHDVKNVNAPSSIQKPLFYVPETSQNLNSNSTNSKDEEKKLIDEEPNNKNNESFFNLSSDLSDSKDNVENIRRRFP